MVSYKYPCKCSLDLVEQLLVLFRLFFRDHADDFISLFILWRLAHSSTGFLLRSSTPLATSRDTNPERVRWQSDVSYNVAECLYFGQEWQFLIFRTCPPNITQFFKKQVKKRKKFAIKLKGNLETSAAITINFLTSLDCPFL